MSPAPRDRPGPARLVGWKEIADALGKSVRTVQRWERELGLPVRRVRTSDTGHTIYADPAELEAWLARQSAGTLGADDDNGEDDGPQQDQPANPTGTNPPPVPGRGRAIRPQAAGALAAALLIAAVALWALWRPSSESGSAAQVTASGAGPIVAAGAVRPDSNDLLYVTDQSGIVVLNGSTLDPDPVAVMGIPEDASFTSLGVSAPSADGRVLLAATVSGSGVAAFDLTTGGPPRWFRVGTMRRVARARLSPDGGTLVAIEQDGRVHVIDVRTGVSRGTVSVPGQNFDGYFDRTGRLVFVPNRDAGDISVVDVTGVRVVDRIPADAGAHSIVTTPGGERGFISNEYAGTVSCVDLVERQVIDTIPVGVGPNEIAISLDGQSVYVANRGDGSLVVIDSAACQVRARILDVLDGVRPGPIAVSNDGLRLFVAALDDPFIGVLDLACEEPRRTGTLRLRTVASSLQPGPLAPVSPAVGGRADAGDDCGPSPVPTASSGGR